MNLVIVGPVVKTYVASNSISHLVNALRALNISATIICSESKKYHQYECHSLSEKSIHWSSSTASEWLKQADAVLYLLGNAFPYYEGVLHLRQQYPGVVLMQDYCFANLFLDFIGQQTSAENAQRELKDYVSYWYGDKAAKKCAAAYMRVPDEVAIYTENFAKEARQYFPLTEWGVMALGVIATGCSDEVMQRIAKVCSGPVVNLNAEIDWPNDAQRILNIIHAALKLAPVLTTAQQIGMNLSAWGMTPDCAAVKYIVDPLQGMVG